MTRVHITDEAALQRRAGLPWAWFEELFTKVLRPRAERTNPLHAESFYCGHRLLGIDGTEWSLRNTQAITSQSGPRHYNGLKEAAFYKWGTAVLLELGTHQPLGVARALPQEDHTEGELNIARRTLGAIPRKEDTLLLADRLYGCASFICDVQQTAGKRCQVLVRVSTQRKATVLKTLADGSALVHIQRCAPGTNRPGEVLQVREIRGEVWRQRTESKAAEDSSSQDTDTPQEPERTEVRLWTTLLDEKEHPAEALLKLYARRWEQELFFSELKSRTARNSLLRAGSLQGAEAEFGALIMAASLLAAERVKAAQSVGLEPVRLSINKIGQSLEALLPLLQAAEGIITPRQQQRIITRFLAQVARESIIKPRRSRSCQRGLRKPQCSWPRIHARFAAEGPFVYKVITS